MTDHMAILKERIERAETKVQRLQKSLEASESELSDLMTALRVIEGINSAPDANASATTSTMARQLEIVKLLGVGRERGSAPADLYAAFIRAGTEDITIDTFRTTIWRMKDKSFDLEDGAVVAVHGDAGVYWKELLEPPEPDYDRDDYFNALSEPDWAKVEEEPPF